MTEEPEKVAKNAEENKNSFNLRRSVAYVNENYIKREKHKKQDTKRYVENMRHSLPNYTIQEIREFRLPYHEALIINLEETGFVSSSRLIMELVKFQDIMREQAPPGSNIAMRPQLKQSKDEIMYLREKLKICETFHNEQNYNDECDEFLKLSVYFAFSNSDWWWLGEQLLIQSIKVSSDYPSLEGKYEALSRFAYARFLADNVKEFDNAKRQLELTSNLCEGKGWTSAKFFPEVRGTLFMQTCQAIYNCMIRDVKLLMKVDQREAIRLATQAKRMAAKACHFNGESEALVLKGICQMAIMDTKRAVNSFLSAFAIQDRVGTIEGQCKVRIQLAKAYLLDGCANSSLNILMKLKHDAEDNNLPYYLAAAYKSLGEYYLSSGQPEKANPLLKKSLKILTECNADSLELATFRNLEAISAGLQRFPNYIEVLNNAGSTSKESFNFLMDLVKWKDQRTEFWAEADNLHRDMSVDQIIDQSTIKVQQSQPHLLDQKFIALSSNVLFRLQAKSHFNKSEEETETSIEKGEAKKTKVKIQENKYDDKQVDIFADKIDKMENYDDDDEEDEEKVDE